MPSQYPGNLDALPTTRVTGNTIVASDHNDTADAVNKIEAELGTNPRGSAASVRARMETLESSQTTQDTRLATLESPMVIVAAPTGVAATDTTAINDASTAGGVGGTLVFRRGNYATNATLTPLRDQVWIGAGQQLYSETTGGTRILYTGSAFAFDIKIRNLSVRNMKIECASPALGCVHFLDSAAGDTNSTTWDAVTFKGYDKVTPTLVQMSGQVGCNCHHAFRSCTFHTFRRGLHLSGYANGNLFQSCVFFNAAVSGGTAVDLSALGTDTLGGQDNLFQRCEFADNVDLGINLANSAERNVFVKCVTDGTVASAAIGAGHNMFIGSTLQQSPTFTVAANATTVFIATKRAGDDLTTQRIDLGDAHIARFAAGVIRAGGRFVAAGGLSLEAMTAASAPNNTIFLDSADNVIKRKDNAGAVAAI